MKRTLFFIACVLASITVQAQENSNDYIPFVEKGKTWHVVCSKLGSYHFNSYMLMTEEVVKNGKTYLRMYHQEDDLTVVYDVGLLREEDRKVYFIAHDSEEESLLFDYSLKAGDTYEAFSYEEGKMVTYKVLSVGDYTEGPKVPRYLRKWTLCRTDDEDIQMTWTWIEGIGSSVGPLAGLSYASPISTFSYLAYVENQSSSLYLPFSFSDGYRQIHGSDMPTGEADDSDDRQHQLTYELDGDRLHVYGKVLTQGGLNNYAYFIEETTDDPLVCRLHFEIQAIEPLPDSMPDSDGLSLHTTDFYVLGFDPNTSYTVVDNQGKEHPVINKTQQIAYRPFIEDGKIWVVSGSTCGDSDITAEWTDYCYLDGDTIVGGQECKKMKCVRYANEDNWLNGAFTPGLLHEEYIGAFYEQDRKVYYASRGKQSFELLYDFTLSTNDTFYIEGFPLVVKKTSGEIEGFKGMCYEFWHDGQLMARWLEGIGSDSWPYVNYPFEWTGGSGSLHAITVGDEVVYNRYIDSNPYLIQAERERFDFTHTIKTRPKAPKREEAVPALHGDYCDSQLDICLAPLDEAYLVQIANESGKVVYEKAINAGSIVALNIDISAYAKGRYTVTIENSHESFSGVFESQTSGIAENTENRMPGNKSIFNLQGQRISSLQKGLNIVNGQKVFVK